MWIFLRSAKSLCCERLCSVRSGLRQEMEDVDLFRNYRHVISDISVFTELLLSARGRSPYWNVIIYVETVQTLSE